jgi:hypothetical protein
MNTLDYIIKLRRCIVYPLSSKSESELKQLAETARRTGDLDSEYRAISEQMSRIQYSEPNRYDQLAQRQAQVLEEAGMTSAAAKVLFNAAVTQAEIGRNTARAAQLAQQASNMAPSEEDKRHYGNVARRLSDEAK